MKRLRLAAVFGLSILLLAACGAPKDASKPVVNITSADTASSPTYLLQGYTFDDEAVTSLSYTLRGGSATNLVVGADGDFGVDVTLVPGDNVIVVTAGDAAGNTAKANLTVNYQAPPTGAGVVPMVAERGDTVTITGSNFGDSGTVTVGGVEATVTNWSDTEITVVLPDATPDGFQEVAIESAFGTDSFPGFFVGVEYAGDAAGLQAFLDGLGAGTAVLLQAQAYDLAGSGLDIDNHSLYGRGADSTVLTMASGLFFAVYAETGSSVTVADMSVDTDGFVLRPGSLAADSLSVTGSSPSLSIVRGPRSLGLPRPTGTRGHRGEAPAKETTELVLPKVSVQGEPVLQTQGIPDTKIVLRGLDIAEVTDGSGGLGTDSADFYGDVEFSDVHYAGTFVDLTTSGAVAIAASEWTPEAAVDIVALGGLTANDSTLRAGTIDLTAPLGVLSIGEASLVEGTGGVDLGANGIVLDGATVRATNGGVSLAGDTLQGAPVHVSNSTLEALDADPADAFDTGILSIVTLHAPIVLEDNPSIRSHGDMSIVTEESLANEADIVLRNNASVRAGVFKADVSDPANARPATLSLVTLNAVNSDPGDSIVLENNVIGASQRIDVYAGYEESISTYHGGNLALSGNTLRAGDGNSDGEIYVEVDTANSGVVTLDSNELISDFYIEVYAFSMDGGDAQFTNNTLRAVGDNGPSVYAGFSDGSCVATGNVLYAEDTADDDSTYSELDCTGLDPAVATFDVEGNELTAIGNVASYTYLYFAYGALSLTGNTVASENKAYLTVTTGQATAAGNTFMSAQGDDFTAADGATEFYINGDATTAASLSIDGDTFSGGGIRVLGNEFSSFSLAGSTITLDKNTRGGLALIGIGDATATGNSFTATGTLLPNPGGSTALGINAAGVPVTVTATDNTFTGFANALYFEDAAAAAVGIDATITGNVFDFAIDAAPEVAELVNVGDMIVATNNVWGQNTDLAVVQSYVTGNGDTDTQGGGIDLDPIALP